MLPARRANHTSAISPGKYQTPVNTHLDAFSQLWFVAHTRPRMEKKLLRHCEREGLSASLPCYQTMHKYRGKSVTFEKPLFPGYVFLRLREHERSTALASDCIANLLFVTDQEQFSKQLDDIIKSVESGLDIQLAPSIGPGSLVKIKYGPLQGVEAWVEERHGMTTVLLRLDFIGQAAAIRMNADNLELVA